MIGFGYKVIIFKSYSPPLLNIQNISSKYYKCFLSATFL